MLGRELTLRNVLLLLNAHSDLLKHFWRKPTFLSLVHIALLTNRLSRDDAEISSASNILSAEANCACVGKTASA